MIRPFLFQRLALAAVVAASVLASRSAAAQDYKPGDRVTVIHWDVKFEASGKSVGETELGDNYTVDRVDGNWLWVKNERGYLRASDVRPYDDAMAYFTDRVRTEADSTAYHDRGCAWLEREEYDIAIGDFNDALRLDVDAATYCCRGNAWDAKGEYDNAIADYNEAIQLKPSEAVYYSNRGGTWRTKGNLDNALADCNEAIRLDPSEALYWGSRGQALIVQGEFDGAASDLDEAIRLKPSEFELLARAYIGVIHRDSAAIDNCRKAIEISGRSGTYGPYAIVLANLSARFAGRSPTEFGGFGDAADAEVWPEPVIAFLSGRMSEASVLEHAKTIGEQTEAHCYLGYDSLLRDEVESARQHFKWVRDHGDKQFIEYPICVAELRRLEQTEVVATSPE